VVSVFNRAAERMFAIAARDAIGTPCRDLCPDDPFRLLHTLGTGEIVPFEEREHRAGGRTLSIAVGTSLLRGEDGAAALAIALARDVTDEKRIRARLEQHERLSAMGALASGIAHEIRNPLNAIHMIVQRFRREFVPREDADEYLRLADTMRSEVLRVNAIITQFLEFARPPKPDLRPADLAQVLRRAAAVIEGEAAAAGIAVSLDLPERAACVLDEQRLLQALLNLFQNGLQAMPSGGTLSVSLQRAGDTWRCTVRDTGIGIPPETLAKIFNLYFTTKSNGSGIGLSIVHQIVSEHGGDITVQSAPGAGSTFVVSLPAAAADTASES
jgi:signal transduction histidine kinase